MKEENTVGSRMVVVTKFLFFVCEELNFRIGKRPPPPLCYVLVVGSDLVPLPFHHECNNSSSSS